MAPRSPPEVSNSKIVKELRTAVRNIYASDERSKLTVNYARQVVEAKLGLGDGFLKEGDWKAKSKQVIFDALVSYTASVEPVPRAMAAYILSPSKRPKSPKPSVLRTPHPVQRGRDLDRALGTNRAQRRRPALHQKACPGMMRPVMWRVRQRAKSRNGR
jgi:hypothetical protein